MKKMLIVFGVVAFAFTFTSCKKECACTSTGIVKITLTDHTAKNKRDCVKDNDKYQYMKCVWK